MKNKITRYLKETFIFNITLFSYCLDPERKLPPVTFHPCSFFDTFGLGTVHERLL